jgi:hypothetical protein
VPESPVGRGRRHVDDSLALEANRTAPNTFATGQRTRGQSLALISGVGHRGRGLVQRERGALPFAASKEGAASSPTTDYSVALIDETKNSTEGGQRLAWYKLDRYLDRDEFTVVVTP